MADLEFYGKGHTYMVDGERIPCVSDLTRFISREVYGEAPQWRLEAAAVKGTAVHAATEALDKAGTAEIEEEYSGYLEAYAKFLREHEVRWELVEHPDWHEGDRYAGTIDRYGLIDGALVLVDLKTVYTVHKVLYGASLNLYRRILEHRGYEVEKLAILHLRRDGSYRLIWLPTDEEMPTLLLALHGKMQKKRRNNERRTETQ